MLVSTRVYNPLKSVGDYKIVVAFHTSLLYNNSIVIEKGFQMSFEKRVLSVVSEVTSVPAHFFNGTLFLETTDSKIATDVFFTLTEKVTAALAFGKCGSETSYDFL